MQYRRPCTHREITRLSQEYLILQFYQLDSAFIQVTPIYLQLTPHSLLCDVYLTEIEILHCPSSK